MCDEIIEATQAAPTVEVVDIQFRPGQKVYFFDPAGLSLVQGDHVIMDTARGPEYGTCTGGNHWIPQSEIVSPLRPVLRVATAQDERIAEENQIKERRAFEVCQKKIRERELEMQLVSAECAFDGSKILFFFTADERVDFRELVKDLACTFHTRIELRQIGVRDKAKMVGGLGICGRLMCCLKYEQDAYEDLIKNSPKAESFVDTPEGRGTVVDLELLRQRVKVKMEDHPETVSTFPIAEIAVLRNGKAKKNDPPIPADLAPISGNGKRVKPEQAPEEGARLDPIRFRYSTEKIVDEPEPAEPEEAEIEEVRESERQQRRRNRKPRQERPQEAETEAAREGGDEKPQGQQSEKQPEKQPEKHRQHRDKKPNQEKQNRQPEKQPEKPQDQQPEKQPEAEGEEPQKKKNHRRPYYRNRKPRQSGEGGNREA